MKEVATCLFAKYENLISHDSGKEMHLFTSDSFFF